MDAIRTVIFRPFARAAMLAFAVGVSLVPITSIPAAAATVIGSATGNMACSAGMDTVQLSTSAGTSFAVPTGANLITGWSTLAGGDTGTVALLVWRPTATAGTFTLVGESPLVTLTPNSVNTFTLAVPISVHPMDVLGLRVQGRAECIQQPGAGTDVIGYRVGATVAVGATETFLTDPLNLTLDVSATVGTSTPPPPPPPPTGCNAHSKDTKADCAGSGGSRGEDTSARDRSTDDKSAGHKSGGDKSAGDKSAGDKFAGDKFAGDKSGRNS